MQTRAGKFSRDRPLKTQGLAVDRLEFFIRAIRLVRLQMQEN